VTPDLPYWAYGSNLDPVRFTQRCPGHVELQVAVLDDHREAFAGRSRMWGAGVGTLRAHSGSRVLGVLYRLEAAHWQTLDRIEGHPHFYERIVVEVEGTRAWTYLLPATLPLNPPTGDYLEAVRQGRRARGWDPEVWTAASRRATAASRRATGRRA